MRDDVIPLMFRYIKDIVNIVCARQKDYFAHTIRIQRFEVNLSLDKFWSIEPADAPG